MKMHIIYECEQCGKTSTNQTDIYECEANHRNLTVVEQQEYDRLKKEVSHAGAIVNRHKNPQTDKKFDDAVNNLIKFEQEHNLTAK